ncbi:predicted protein [Uncinocarpus reesii 1704]|uniref:Uncharacterized protein n=1 Tax=Uncinocarpus reesii (strain UAMH 1704) TaxID=336963 RepID=C4JEL8_UNCRE|nr:uncharacterized protein UREG_02178 [Uncinocarpus reesii 1704]EEP77329.1 predicted protein [Uncinocarpus reesii 1704]
MECTLSAPNFSQPRRPTTSLAGADDPLKSRANPDLQKIFRAALSRVHRATMRCSIQEEQTVPDIAPSTIIDRVNFIHRPIRRGVPRHSRDAATRADFHPGPSGVWRPRKPGAADDLGSRHVLHIFVIFLVVSSSQVLGCKLCSHTLCLSLKNMANSRTFRLPYSLEVEVAMGHGFRFNLPHYDD